MAATDRNIRLFVGEDLFSGAVHILCSRHSHYLCNVMRLRPDERFKLFNGRDGEWSAIASRTASRQLSFRCIERTRPQAPAPDIWLIFAPLSRSRTEYAIEKATELGVSKIIPAITDFSKPARIRRSRLEAIAIEAAEQCGSITIPTVEEACRLRNVIDEIDGSRRLLVCDETLVGQGNFPGQLAFKDGYAVVIGPEGGFSSAERELFDRHRCCIRCALGESILRAETAAIVALALLHNALAKDRMRESVQA